MSEELPFYGQLGTTDQRSSRSIYIRVWKTEYNEIKVSLYNSPPPFSLNTLVGHFGDNWEIKRVNRGWLISIFIITFIEENAEIEYRTVNKVGDLIERYTTKGMSPFVKAKAKPRTMLDDVQEISGRVIVKGYRQIAKRYGCAPASNTTDHKIIEIYTQVTTAFNEAARRRGEHIPALYNNRIVLKFLQVYEQFTGEHQHFFQEHLRYEVDKYLKEGLRQDYMQELSLFDPAGNDPDPSGLFLSDIASAGLVLYALNFSANALRFPFVLGE